MHKTLWNFTLGVKAVEEKETALEGFFPKWIM